MAGVSGSQSITHHNNILKCLEDQFNKPDVSDLTLQVDTHTFHVHKLVPIQQFFSATSQKRKTEGFIPFIKDSPVKKERKMQASLDKFM